MEYRDFPIRQKTPIKKQPTPTDYSSILVHRLRTENQMLKEKIKQLQRDRSSSPVRTPAKQRKYFKNRDDIQQIFDSKLKGIKQRSLSASKSSKTSQRYTPSQKLPLDRNSIATSKETVRDGYQNQPLVYKVQNTTRKMIHHQPQPSFSSTSSDCLYKGIYLNDSVAIQSIYSKSQTVLTKIQSNKTSTQNSAQKRKKTRTREVSGFGCKPNIQIHGEQSLRSSNVSFLQKENYDQQLRVSSPKSNIQQNIASFKKGRLNNNVYLQQGQKLDDQKSSRMKTMRN